eukprot:209007-Prorocentrum_minimum.AAC.1
MIAIEDNCSDTPGSNDGSPRRNSFIGIQRVRKVTNRATLFSRVTNRATLVLRVTNRTTVSTGPPVPVTARVHATPWSAQGTGGPVKNTVVVIIVIG